jgi:signal peptidase I
MYRRALAVAGALLLLTSCGYSDTKTYTQTGPSMEPTIKVGETVRARLVKKGLYKPRHGDIVVFRPPASWLPTSSDLFVKRVIAVGGEKIADTSYKITVNGTPLDEPYVKDGIATEGGMTEVTVPAGDIFVLGDNRTASADSAIHGPVPATNVTAVVEEH